MIKIEHVSFQYTGASEENIKDFSLHVNKGECVLLTGESGCGKTCVTRIINGLIPHFYEGKMSGQVLIDGVDPEAAEIVMQSGCKITWVPLDATHAAYITVEESKKIRDLGTKPAILVADLIEQRTVGYSRSDAEMRDLKGAPIHDALAVCAVLHPEVLKNVLHCNVHVDIGGSYGYGQTIVERRIRVIEEEKNCYFALNADRDMFYEWMYDTLKKDKERRGL